MNIVYQNQQEVGNILLYTEHFEKAEVSPAVTLRLIDGRANTIALRRDEALALRDYIDQHFERSVK